MIMTVFSTMKMPMEFVISSAFLTPFSSPENDAMHPVSRPVRTQFLRAAITIIRCTVSNLTTGEKTCL